METPKPKRPRGCLFYGCLTSLVLFGVILVGAFVGLHLAKKLINQFTDTKPMSLPAVEATPAQSAEVQHRVDAFNQAVSHGRATPPLALTARDINILLAADPNLRPFRGRVYVTIESNRANVQLSAPMEELGMPMFTGRYLNGSGTLSASIENGNLIVNLQSLTAKGRPMPEPYMNKIRQQNLAQAVNKDPQGKAAVARLQTVQIRDGELVIVPKGPEVP